jgi:flagellar basal-body rod modification protein FlgD
MSIDPSVFTTSIPSYAQTQTSSTDQNMVDYDAFLNLLVAQMKNQDPTAPMDSTDYVAQLATFSQVEQSIQTNTKLDELLQSSMLSQAGSLIGREITSADGAVTGVVTEVSLLSTGAVATLESGEQVNIGAGVTVR